MLVNSFLWAERMNQTTTHSSEKILAAATKIAQAHGYGGLNVRNLATDVGIKAASLYHHFPSKADLAAAVARRYWEDAASTLNELSKETSDPVESLRKYPDVTFRKSLENSNRMCLASFMNAEYDALPDIVKKEVQTFADVNIEWLRKALIAAKIVGAKEAKRRASAIFAAVVGAQLVARGRSDLGMFDMLIDSYRASGLLPN
ncbi:TetR/AcrR family transcriptional regulator [Caballeronia sp. AZ7_KS35]|uniref:TetR/AcrR family transcriptional regulator n=1 Tax=Caballeronia sp. AZ7_KS35 TaxID=2921762 RepID=UPI0020288EF8|nr:TetR/AcrR family transcriptional regulator [Caballeronia sp. AZ7_KS35]